MRLNLLDSRVPPRFVKTCGAGCADQAVSTRRYADLNVQCVAANQTTGGVDQNIVANAVAFGVEALQYAQRPTVQVARNTAV